MPRLEEVFFCPVCAGALEQAEDVLICSSCGGGTGRRYPFREGIPSFVEDGELPSQDRYLSRVYNVLSLFYDTSVKMMFASLGLNERDTRNEILDDLTAPADAKILEVSIGTGANVPLLRERFPQSEIHGCDISLGMLRKCRLRLSRLGLDVVLSHANASMLPYRENSFDAVLHVGGVNSFALKEKSLMEMLRVVRPGGCVVLNDEGLSPERQKQFVARFLIKTIFGFVASLERGEMDPPLDSIPDAAEGVELRYVGKGYFWNLSFRKHRAA